MPQLLTAPYCAFYDDNGDPLSGGKVYTYVAGTTTPKLAYTSSTGLVALPNPVILDSAGRAQIWLTGTYTIVVKDSLGNTIQTTDNIIEAAVPGDMAASVYDPANIREQLVGLTAGQTLTNKTLDSPIITGLMSTAESLLLPQGRLTLSSTVPVMTSDATAQTSVYYLPYTGGYVPHYDGVNFSHLAIPNGMRIDLDSNAAHTGYQQSGKLFDIFVFSNGGTAQLCTGPAWTNSTTRSAAISQVAGIWVNTSSMTFKTDTTTFTGTLSASSGTYVGTLYATANGQTGMAFKPAATGGGANNILGLYNAYNRVTVDALSRDSTASWTYATATWQALNAGGTGSGLNNRISWVDGLQQSDVLAINKTPISTSATGTYGHSGWASIPPPPRRT
jgi:hypothetical protein